MMTTHHPLATAWLDRVATLAADLPPGVRSELLADLGEHLDEALAGVEDPVEVQRTLARLGDPADVVAAARDDGGVRLPPPPPGSLPVGAPPARPTADPDRLTTTETLVLVGVVLLGVGGLLLGAPALFLRGWVALLVPIVLLLVPWISLVVVAAVAGRWTGGETVVLALLPIGWAGPVVSFFVPVGSVQVCESVDGVETCSGGGPGLLPLLVLVAVVVGLVLATRWLARAPRGRPLRR